MYRRIIIGLVFIFFSGVLFAHDFNIGMAPHKKRKKETFLKKENILVGPGFGFGLWQNAFSLNISPSIAYSFHDNFYAGITLGFDYYQETFQAYNFYSNEYERFRYKIPSYNMSIYARAILLNSIILNFEPMIMNVKNYTSAPYSDPVTKKLAADFYRMTIPAVLLGGGYYRKTGDRSHMYYMICYDLTQNPNSPYYSTLAIRLGLMMNLFAN